MKITGITLSGFKSFAEATHLPVDAGLTVVIGPNGCGKSNIIESVRWVMGEGSAKRLRGAEMEDVIFAGTRQRRRRQSAEVSVTLDNATRTAPPPFQDAPEIVVSRRIERGRGSAYRINGQEVRARDVQMLFADLSIGSRSASIISQGEVSELVENKPDARRLLLEEAAGVRGLHARRHDAELKLSQASGNLQRVADILERGQGDLDHLETQARATRRYREIMTRKRRYQALFWWIQDRDAKAELEELRVLHRTQHKAHQDAVSIHNTATIATSRAETALLHKREQDTALNENLLKARDAWQDLERKRERLEGAQTRDAERAEEWQADHQELRASLEEYNRREAELIAEETESPLETKDFSAELQALDQAITELEAICTQDQAQNTALALEKVRVQEQAQNLQRQWATLEKEHLEAQGQQQRLERDLAALPIRDSALEESAHDFTAARAAAEETLQQAYEQRAQYRDRPEAMIKAKAIVEAHVASVSDLARRLKASKRAWQIWQERQGQGLIADWAAPPELASALEAGLGFGLSASLQVGSGYYWREISRPAPNFSNGIESLKQHLAESETTLPPQWQFLNDTLAWIGLVDTDADFSELLPLLQVGQSLVRRDGAGMRWDGLGFGADCSHLDTEQWSQGHLSEQLEKELQKQETELVRAREIYAKAENDWTKLHEAAESAYNQARAERDQCEQEWQQVKRERNAAEVKHRAEEAKRQRLEAELSANTANLQRLSEQSSAIKQQETEAVKAVAEAENTQPDPKAEERQQQLFSLQQQRNSLNEQRIRHQAAYEAALSAQQQRAAEVARLVQQRNATKQRIQELEEKIIELQHRQATSSTDYAGLAQAATLAESHWKAQDHARQEVARAVQEALGARDSASQQQQRLGIELTQYREALLRTESDIEHKTAALHTLAEQAQQAINEPLRELLRKHEFTAKETAMPLAEVNAALGLETRRLDNLGEVNLRADIDVEEKRRELDTLINESADIQSAIEDLHGAIATLNAQGRTKLQATFKEMQSLFSEHFEKLFSGGEAKLVWLETDDPIAPGIDIRARPPGKAMQSVYLLSGGEKSMTALALIGAVLRLRPTPICLLDEVDAALDDANVARFCGLLSELATSNPDMRFVVISHHRLSMAKADHLMGIGMPERGVSRLYAVDMLESANVLADSN